MHKLTLSLFLLFQSVTLAAAPMEQTLSASINLNPSITYQTISGWEATAQAGAMDCQSFDQYSDVLFDHAVNDLGINRVRLEVRSGIENPVDYFASTSRGPSPATNLNCTGTKLLTITTIPQN